MQKTNLNVYYKSAKTKENKKTIRGKNGRIRFKRIICNVLEQKAQIILVVLIFIAIGVIYTVGFTTPKYSASTSLLLAGSGSSGTQTNTITTTDVTLNSKLVSTYSELVKSKNVLGQVISNLNINENYETLKITFQ